MLKAALIFGVVALVPLFMAQFRFKISQSDSEIQVIIKKSMKQTQFVIAGIFGSTALLFALLSFVITDQTTANVLMLTVYIVALLSSIGYAVIRQIKLQKYIRDFLKK